MRYEINENGCWEFIGPIDQSGYGKVSLKSSTYSAHRLMAHLTIKPLMKDTEVVAHRCDNRKCINPMHLFITTAAGNVADRQSKNRGIKGEQCHTAKLTAKDVLEIRKLYEDGASYSKILSYFPIISEGNVQSIVNRRTWKHI